MTGKITAVCQARMSSSRLPGKVLKKIAGKTVLAHLVERISKSNMISDIIIATSSGESDNPIQLECEQLGIKCYRGSLNDVLDRFYNAAKYFGVQGAIMRICCDSPLLDWDMIDDISCVYLNSDFDIVRNDKVPVGFAVEVFDFDWLEKAFNNADKEYQREHVTPYIYENGKVYLHNNVPDYSNYRFTLDTQEDFELLEAVFDKLYHGEHNFHMNDIINVVIDNPDLFDINSGVLQKTSSLDYIKKV